MKRDYFLRFAIAGFSYYEGAIAFNKLKIGKKLKLKREPRNKYDKHAVALYRKGLKLGYIPRDKNRHLSLLLKNGGVNIYQQYDQWPNPYEKCNDGYRPNCYQDLQLTTKDLPSDDKMIEIVKVFANKHGIDLSDLGTPYIDKYWENNNNYPRELK